MDLRSRTLLQHNQQSIIKDLDVIYILDELYSKNAISNEEFDHIYNLTNRVDRTRYLIDSIIQNGNNNAYVTFVDSLYKDYKWLWEKLSVNNSNETMLNSSLEDSLSRGDVPRLPDHYVTRSRLEAKIAASLKTLARHKILVLHGMSGSGKTTAAISTLRNNPELIAGQFNGLVFWMNFANCKTEHDIIALQTKLLRKSSSHNSYMNSSISMSSVGSNADSHSLSTYDGTSQELKDRLKSQMTEQTVKECLLVLDEVNDKSCVEAFDVGCKILITTRDTGVVANFQPQIIKIENNLDEKESLELFASCLDIHVSELPRQAKKLHDLCKGTPFDIALIGAQLAENKERLIDDTRQWKYYIKKLEKKELFSRIITKHQNNQMKTIAMCLNSLNPDILLLFKMLPVFPDNVKVTSKVLSRLWKKDVPEVESIMKQLKSKSLINEIYDHEKTDYIYDIYDLIMDYLRTCVNDDELKNLHVDFLNSYKYNNTDSVPVDIIDDGYIAFYLGHHLSQTKNSKNMWSLFNKLFLNLKFLGNKVRLTGPADVIYDLQKYESHIVECELDKELLHSIKAYLSTHGIDLYRYPCTDIVQSVLQHEANGILFTKAWELAKECCKKNKLYFEFLHEQNIEEIKHSTIDVKENITSVSFLGDYVLIGTTTGVIKIFQISTNKLKKEIPGHGQPISWMGACPINPPFVASLAQDGVVKFWYIDDVETDDAEIIEEESEESYNNNYPSSVTLNPKQGRILNCRWANREEKLFAHTSKMIIIYQSSGQIDNLIDNFERDEEIIYAVPCDKDTHVIAATKSNGYKLKVIDLRTKDIVMCLDENEPALNILTVPESNRIIVLKSNEVVEHELKINSKSYQNNCNICRCKNVVKCQDIKEEMSFLSIAVNKTGTLLFVSTDDSRIICIDLKTNSILFNLENRRGNVISMAVSEVWYDFVSGSDVLLTGTGTIENSAKVWYLDASYVSSSSQKNGKARLTTNFDVSFLDTMSPITPSSSAPNSETASNNSTPKRHKSFVNHSEISKKPAKKTKSLDRHALKPLNFKGICNGNNEGGLQPLLAVVDDKNHIQIMRGRKILSEIRTKSDEQITVVKISPCNQYIIYGLGSGSVKKYALRTKEIKLIIDVYSPVHYLDFLNSNLLLVAGKNRCIMAYHLTDDGDWKPEMLQEGNTHLGSQEILNDIQGIKKKNGHSDKHLSSGSETSLNSRDRCFPISDRKGRLCNRSGLLKCFWIDNLGLVTIENNATIKLFDKSFELSTVLNGRQCDVHVNCAAFQKNILVICDEMNMKFQTFELRDNGELATIQEYKLNNRITCCDLTTDGCILAMGLDSGDVIIWNVMSKRQLRLLKHHKNKVQFCRFSPVPEKLFRTSNAHSPTPHTSQSFESDGEPPLVLVTMASEIVWWNITYLIKVRVNRNNWKMGMNVVSPLTSPIENRCNEMPHIDNLTITPTNPVNFFFGNGVITAKECWKELWKKKTYKEGSKKKEILACIKLSGMNAKKLCFDEKFSCFVTVDNPGHIHIMNMMSNNDT